MSGLAFFLSGDLAPQDLWNSKKIEKAAVLSPNFVDYLLLVLTKFKVGMTFPLHTPSFLPSYTRIVVILLLGFRVAENGKTTSPSQQRNLEILPKDVFLIEKIYSPTELRYTRARKISCFLLVLAKTS